MSNITISAEIIPVKDRAQLAAKALQQIGFRILHVGTSISVQASDQVWKDTFHVSFVEKVRQRVPGSPGSSFKYAVPDRKSSIRTPALLRDLVAEVLFIEPPELF
jgi:hypothetical protein